ncbi:MAG: CPBP family intramembrane metalloprotease [Myxococcales bacterium]|nr:CPBP family intramembrane metalloprotease [Myxococcales bacterium]
MTTSPFSRPLGPVAAALWAAAVLVLYVLLADLALTLKPSTAGDGVASALLYTASVLVVVFAVARVHAPEAELTELVGARPVGFAVLLVAGVAGAAAYLPLSAFERWVLLRAPDPQRSAEIAQALALVPRGSRVFGTLALALVAPLADEILFRGALFHGVLRKEGRTTATVATTLGFALVSTAFLPKLLPLYVVLGLALAHARAATSSVLPAMALHLGYRGVELATTYRAHGTLDPLATGEAPARVSLAVGVGAGVAAIVLLGLLARLGDADVIAADDGDA